MIRIVDYGLGNIQAFLTVYNRLGIPAARARSPEELEGASRLILPGVGAFDYAMTLLDRSGMRPRLESLVHEEKLPILGVCVGMQMLASGSDEGKLAGLNWIPGRVRAFASHPSSAHLPMPHMGWNDVHARSGGPLFSEAQPTPRFYFLHSYFFDCDSSQHGIAKASYGYDFDCAVSNGNVHGVQFHPEKSHGFGVELLKNFALN